MQPNMQAQNSVKELWEEDRKLISETPLSQLIYGAAVIEALKWAREKGRKVPKPDRSR